LARSVLYLASDDAAFVIERMVELAAAELKIDSTELRRRNFIPPSAMPFKTGLTFTYDSGEFEQSMDMALKMADVKGFPARKEESLKRGRLRGLGLSYTIERAGAASLEGAEVRFDRSGAVTLFSGSNSQGQGHETVFKQLVCDRLGINPNEAYYVQGDTDEVFFGEGTGGSRSSSLAGSAFHLATEKIVTKARAIAALDPGETVVVTAGQTGRRGTTNLITRAVVRDAARAVELGQVIGPRVDIVSGSRLIGRAVSSPVMGNSAVTLGIEKQHLCFPRRAGQWPAVRENNRRAGAPVTIVESSTVTGFYCRHRISPLLVERPTQHAGSYESWQSLAGRRLCLQKGSTLSSEILWLSMGNWHLAKV